jgi:Ku70/Ku80 beta-barrel domain
VVFETSFYAASTHRRTRGSWFTGLDHVRIGNRRKRHIAGIFDRRRCWIGIRNFGWRKRRHVPRRNARRRPGRLGNLLRMGVKFFQYESPCHYALTPVITRSRRRRRFQDDSFYKRMIAQPVPKKPAARNRASRACVIRPPSSPRVAFRGMTCRHGHTRAYWKGYLKLSLVTCPVALFPAASNKEKISFHLLNGATGHRLKQQFVDSETGGDREDRVKGYQVGKATTSP